MGTGTVIGERVVLGSGVQLGHYVVVHDDTVLEDGVVVDDFAVLGKRPAASATSTLTLSDLAPLRVGAGTHVGTGAILYGGSEIGGESFIADGAQIRERCRIGRRVVVGRGVTIENDTTVGDFTKLQTGAYLTAKSTVEDHVFIAPGVMTSNDPYIARTEARHAATRGPTIRRAARLGVAAILLPGVEVGQEAVVAAGAVVTKDVPPYQVVMGIPARVVRPTPAEQWLFPPDGTGTGEESGSR
jgi:acetyltransferase-like isoleucine patch superfamily enzyme